MSAFAVFLDTLLHEGKAILRDRPEPLESPDAGANALLCRAFAEYRLSVAGPLIPFDPDTALAAAVVVQHACWFLVNRAEPDAVLEKCLVLPGPPRSPAQHLSADLTLRYLPQVHRRARAHNPADRLTILLADLLRRWPLSGVSSDADEGPLTPILFEAHSGLLLLYAERLAEHQNPAGFQRGQGWDIGSRSANSAKIRQPCCVRPSQPKHFKPPDEGRDWMSEATADRLRHGWSSRSRNASWAATRSWI